MSKYNTTRPPSPVQRIVINGKYVTWTGFCGHRNRYNRWFGDGIYQCAKCERETELKQVSK